jgi:hypothetical protein
LKIQKIYYNSIKKVTFKECPSKRTQLLKLLQNLKLWPRQIAKPVNQGKLSINQEKLYLIKVN